MAKMRTKGVLLTLGLAFYCAAFLTLALLLIDHTNDSRAVGNDLSVMGRISADFISIEKSARDVFEQTSGIRLSANGTSIMFSETLPNPQASEYVSAIGALESFSEGYLSIGGITAAIDTSESRGTMPFLIDPYGIIVTHDSYGGNEFVVIPAQINFDSYSINLRAQDSVACNSSGLQSGTDFSVTINVIGDLESSCLVNQSLSASLPSSYSINNGSIMLNFTNGGLAITSLIDNAYAEIAINFPDFSGKEPAIYLNDTITLSSTNPSISKSSRVRLL